MLVPGNFLVNRYEIIEKIGSGGMADVYKAKDSALNRLVAIKVLKPDYSSDAGFVRKFRAEAQSAAGLSHPNIVNVFDVGAENNTYFIVMELVQGITLKNYIDMKGKLEIREALNISVQIAQGLSAAHDNRIIHRDIKPQNIIMSRDGKVKVTDFGIAKMADSTTVTTTAAGTVHYISPEQARGGYSDEKSDIYSLGITMYEMLTGKVPFEGETNVAVALLHIEGEMTPPSQLEPSIPKSFEKIILKCTQKKPENRYPSARALIADLRKVLSQPDGDYVVIPGVSTAGTIVMGDQELAAIRKGSAVPDGATRTRVVDVEAEAAKEAERTAALEAEREAAEKAAAREKLRQQVAEEEAAARERRRRKQEAEEAEALGRRRRDDDDDDDDERSGGGILIAVGVIAFIVLAAVIAFFVMRSGLIGGGSTAETETQIESQTLESITEAAGIEVPDLMDMTREEAKAALNELGLGVTFKTGESEDVESGHVYKQSPAAFETVELHSTVTVYISTGSDEKSEMPDVKDMDYEEAQELLEEMGLVVKTAFQEDDDVEEDHVIRTSPVAGAKVKEGQTVTMYVSQGGSQSIAYVPNLLGMTVNQANNKLLNNGLVLGTQSSDYSDTYAEGEIMAQSMESGSEVVEGTTINVTVSKGPKQTSAPTPSSYSATVYLPSPFDTDVTTDSGDVDVYSEGQVRVDLTQDGSTQTIYNSYVSSSSIASSVSVESTSSSSATATMYVNGSYFDSWTVYFD